MLYATTRNKNDVHTAYKTIHQDCAPDGGLFLPFSMPKLEASDIAALKNRSCGENMAHILNIFFSTNLKAFDMDFTIGRGAIFNTPINNRLVVAECWHNSHWRFDYVMQCVSDHMRKENVGDIPTNWMGIAIRISALFGIYGMMLAAEQVTERAQFDMAVTSGDFAMPMAAWYAREMGLPISNIICGCNANGAAWELLHRGQLNTSAVAVKTCTPAADAVLPRNLERLIYSTAGSQEIARYLECCRTGSVFKANELTFDKVREGFFASVNSDSRVASLISNFYRTNHYVLSPYAALAYGSLTDYRAKTGESRTAVLISEVSPVRDDAYVAEAMNISVPELEKLLNLA